MLPQGYILTSKKERDAEKKRMEEEKKNQKTIEEQIEEERAALPSEGLTPVTKDSFFAWKERRKKEKQQALEDALKKSLEDKAAKKAALKGKNSIMNGRALFAYNPELFKDDDIAVESQPQPEANEESKQEDIVDENLFKEEAGNEEEEEVDFDN